MPRPSIDIEIHRSYIVHLWNEDYSLSDILQKLHEEHSVRIGRNTLKRRLTEWSLQKRVLLEDTPFLRMRIIALTYITDSNSNHSYEALVQPCGVLF